MGLLVSITLLYPMPLPAASRANQDSGQSPVQGSTPNPGYRLAPNDVIKVQVFGEEALTTETRVSGDGKIALPLLGVLEIKGLTVKETEPPPATGGGPADAAGKVALVGEIVRGPMKRRDTAAVTLPFGAEFTLTVRVAPVLPAVTLSFCHATPKTVFPRCASGMVTSVLPVMIPAVAVTVTVLLPVMGFPFWSETV